MHILPSWSYRVLQLFPTEQPLFISPISAFDTLMTLAEFTKIATCRATAFVKDMFYCNHTPRAMDV